MMKKVITKCVLDMESIKWIPELEKSYYYNGKWGYFLGTIKGMFSGASSEDKGEATEDEQFQQLMEHEQNTAFQGQQEALNTINQAMTPLVKGGAYQYGFSTAEDQALQSQIENAGATATANTVAAQQLREQQATGGAGGLPTGAQEALETQARETGAQKTAAQLGQEKELGYQTGRENFLAGTQAEEQVASLENPAAFANAATNAGDLSLNAIKNVDTNNANSLTAKLLGGTIGGIGSMITGKTSNTGGAGTSVLNTIGTVFGG